MIDFTSSLYLGLRHSTTDLAPWISFTTGRPAVLEPPERTSLLERRLAALQGCEAALVAPSTLHLAWDLFGFLARKPATLYVDEGTYSILRGGVERAVFRGARVRWIRHHDVDDLRRALRAPGHRGTPIVVSDGFCPACGTAAPLRQWMEESDGLIVVDDTQSLGVFGARGGGSLVDGPRLPGPVLAISSLAKAFGVPVAALVGDRRLVERFASGSETRVHSSPPSTASLHAAAHALDINDARGRRLRARLRENVSRWRQGIERAGLATRADDFPVQTLRVRSPIAWQGALSRRGIETFVARARCSPASTLNFIVRADHAPDVLDHSTAVMRSLVAGSSAGSSDTLVLSSTKQRSDQRSTCRRA